MTEIVSVDCSPVHVPYYVSDDNLTEVHIHLQAGTVHCLVEDHRQSTSAATGN